MKFEYNNLMKIIILCLIVSCLSSSNINLNTGTSKNINSFKPKIFETRFKEKEIENKSSDPFYRRTFHPKGHYTTFVKRTRPQNKSLRSLKKVDIFIETIKKMKIILRSVFILLKQLEKYKTLIETNKVYHDKYDYLNQNYFKFKQIDETSSNNFENNLILIKTKLKSTIESLMPFSKYFKRNQNPVNKYLLKSIPRINLENDIKLLLEIKINLETILSDIHKLILSLKSKYINDQSEGNSQIQGIEQKNLSNNFDSENNEYNLANEIDIQAKSKIKTKQKDDKDLEYLYENEFNNHFSDKIKTNDDRFVNQEDNKLNQNKNEKLEVKIGLETNSTQDNSEDFNKNNNNIQTIDDEINQTDEEYANLISLINNHLHQNNNAKTKKIAKDLNPIKKTRKHILGDNKDSGNSQDANKHDRVDNNKNANNEIKEYENLNNEIKDSNSENKSQKIRLSANPPNLNNQNNVNNSNNIQNMNSSQQPLSLNQQQQNNGINSQNLNNIQIQNNQLTNSNVGNVSNTNQINAINNQTQGQINNSIFNQINNQPLNTPNQINNQPLNLDNQVNQNIQNPQLNNPINNPIIMNPLQNQNLLSKNKRLSEENMNQKQNSALNNTNEKSNPIPFNINININQIPVPSITTTNVDEEITNDNSDDSKKLSKSSKHISNHDQYHEFNKLKDLIKKSSTSKNSQENDTSSEKIVNKKESKDKSNDLLSEINNAITEIEDLEKKVNSAEKSKKLKSKSHKHKKTNKKQITIDKNEYNIKEGLEYDNFENNSDSINFIELKTKGTNAKQNEKLEVNNSSKSIKEDIVKFLKDTIK